MIPMSRQIADKIANAPVPTAEEIERNLRALARKAQTGCGLTIRGKASDRRIRTAKLLAEFGDGTSCGCWMCGTVLTAETLQQDKIFTTAQGGRYRMSNLLPACGPCNGSRHETPIR